MTVYNAKSLLQKLGVKNGKKVLVLNPPDNCMRIYDESPVFMSLIKIREGFIDFIQLFTKKITELEREFPLLKNILSLDGMLWVSWPKKTSYEKTDLNENKVREIGLKNGLVDIKVVSLNDTWSALKFVFRRKEWI